MPKTTKSFPYKTKFKSIARAVVSDENDCALSLATLENLKPLLPKDIDLDENIDLLPFACDGAVVNRANLNDDLIDTPTILSIAENFKYKFMDLEHDRSKIVGVLANYGFSIFGSSQIIATENIKESLDPYNFSIGGYVWRAVSETFAEELEKSSDPNSSEYESISTSWELGFFEYYLILGSKNINEAEVIKDEKQIKEFSQYLRAEGGNGQTPDGVPVYRTITGSGDTLPLALGFGFTYSPAAKVKGVLTAEAEKDKKNISHNKKRNVIKDSMKSKPKSISEITDDMLSSEADINASDLKLMLRDEVEKENKKFVEDLENEKTAKAEVEQKLKEQEDQYKNIEKENTANKEKIDNLEKEVQSLKAEKEAKEKEAKLSERMASLDENYVLDADQRKYIGAQIKDLDEESYSQWESEFTKFLNKKEEDNNDLDVKQTLAKAKKDEPKIPVTNASSTDPLEAIAQNFKVEVKK